MRAIEAQTDGLFREENFMPLPCAHPNCHTLTYAYRDETGKVHPLMRFIDAKSHLDLLANGIALSRPRGRELIQGYLQASGCVDGACDGLDAWLGALDAVGWCGCAANPRHLKKGSTTSKSVSADTMVMN